MVVASQSNAGMQQPAQLKQGRVTSGEWRVRTAWLFLAFVFICGVICVVAACMCVWLMTSMLCEWQPEVTHVCKCASLLFLVF